MSCPNCGYCPHCGRGGWYQAPYYIWHQGWHQGQPLWSGGTTAGNYTSGNITISATDPRLNELRDYVVNAQKEKQSNG